MLIIFQLSCLTYIIIMLLVASPKESDDYVFSFTALMRGSG